MAKRQSRRTISISGRTYVALRRLCDAEGVSVSGWVERLIIEKLSEHGVEPVSRAERNAWLDRHRADRDNERVRKAAELWCERRRYFPC